MILGLPVIVALAMGLKTVIQATAADRGKAEADEQGRIRTSDGRD